MGSSPTPEWNHAQQDRGRRSSDSLWAGLFSFAHSGAWGLADSRQQMAKAPAVGRARRPSVWDALTGREGFGGGGPWALPTATMAQAFGLDAYGGSGVTVTHAFT